MSTLFVYTCDRCKKEVSGSRSDWLLLAATYRDRSWDLCEECKEKFFAFMKKAPYKD